MTCEFASLLRCVATFFRVLTDNRQSNQAILLIWKSPIAGGTQGTQGLHIIEPVRSPDFLLQLIPYAYS